MMTEMEVAVTIVKLAGDADGGCASCAANLLGEAIDMHPELPWALVIEGLAAEDDRYEWASEYLTESANL